DVPVGVVGMSWVLRIEHQTRYHYRDEVQASYNEARMTPLTTDRQMTVESRLAVEPRTQPYRYLDYWATVVDAFDIHVPHTDLALTATSVVETTEAPDQPPRPGVGAPRRPARPRPDGGVPRPDDVRAQRPRAHEAGRRAARRVGAGRHRRRRLPLRAPPPRLLAGRHRGVEFGAGGAARPGRRLPGLCPPVDRPAAGGGGAGPLRLGLSPPGEGRPAGRHRLRREPRLGRGLARRLVGLRSDQRRPRGRAPRRRRPGPGLRRRPAAQGRPQRRDARPARGRGPHHPPRLSRPRAALLTADAPAPAQGSSTRAGGGDSAGVSVGEARSLC